MNSDNKKKISEALQEIESDIRENKGGSEFCSFLENYNCKFCLCENFHESEGKYNDIVTLPVVLKHEDVRFDDTPPIIPQIRERLEKKASEEPKISDGKNKTIYWIGFSPGSYHGYLIDYLGSAEVAYKIYLEIWLFRQED